jgi:taurine dioxygenase
MPATLSVKPLANVGAEVGGVDWAEPITTDIAEALYAAWLEYGVLVFPKAGVNSDIHLRLSRVFGELEVHPLKALQAEDHKELAPFGDDEQAKGGGVICNGEHLRGYLFAHQDTSYTPNLCKGSMLRMIQIPERGGDTRFWDTAKAYRDLPPAMKARLETLSTIQMMRIIPPPRAWGMRSLDARPADVEKDRQMSFPQEWPLVLHPMVLTHPESGLKTLLLSPQGYVRIDTLEQAESDALFDEVASHALKPEYEYRHRWSVHDMVLWDNRRMMHMAAGWPYGQRRFAYRTTLKGGMAVGRPYTTADGASTMSTFA